LGASLASVIETSATFSVASATVWSASPFSPFASLLGVLAPELAFASSASRRSISFLAFSIF
jgi:hypothetical protein